MKRPTPKRRSAPAPWRARGPAADIDDYLSRLPPDTRAALEGLRRTIRAAAPQAVEVISYQIPTYRWYGMLVGFAASASHCTFHIMSTAVFQAHRKDLATYETGKGSIRFQPGVPLPAVLVRKLVKARLAENSAALAAKKEKKKRGG